MVFSFHAKSGLIVAYWIYETLLMNDPYKTNHNEQLKVIWKNYLWIKRQPVSFRHYGSFTFEKQLGGFPLVFYFFEIGIKLIEHNLPI